MKSVRALALLFVATASAANAQAPGDFPTRPVKFLVPFAAGGPTDVVTRILADLLSAHWGGQSVVVENRPGAGTILATAAVAKAPADGYTLLVGTNSIFINPAIGQKLPYDTLKELSGVSMLATQPVALVASNAFAPNTVAELVALAKRSPEPINFTSPGPRGVGHLSGAMLTQRAGIKMVHVNYNGSAPALVDVIAGRVPIMFDIWHSAKRYIGSGGLKLIASASAQRFSDALQVPTLSETYPSFAVAAVNIVYGPSGIPSPVIEKLSADIRAVVNSKGFAEKVAPLGIDAKGSTPQEVDAFTRAEIARWAEVARAAGIKADD